MLEVLRAAERRHAALHPRHGRGLRRAHRAQGPAARPDQQLEPGLGGDREPRRSSSPTRSACCRPSCARAATTTRRLTRFADDTNPLITQLRPAARQLSPTLIDLDALAPDLRGLFSDLDPLVRVSRAGLPATEQVLDNTQPAARAGSTRSCASSRRSSTTSGSTSARSRPSSATTPRPPRPRSAGFNDPSQHLHYLRTTNPLNPEMMTGWPYRLGHEPLEPVHRAGRLRQARTEGHLEVFGSYLCTSNPTPAPPAAERVPERRASPTADRRSSSSAAPRTSARRRRATRRRRSAASSASRGAFPHLQPLP